VVAESRYTAAGPTFVSEWGGNGEGENDGCGGCALTVVFVVLVVVFLVAPVLTRH
jgi:hypothetical protein